MSTRRSGFTLIELLVVIAVILVLAAILFPVFASAQKAAIRNTCASNMRQLAIGITNYCSDWAGKTPPVMPFTGGSGPSGGFYRSPSLIGVGWPGRIRKYVKSDKLFQCPACSGNRDWFLPNSPRFTTITPGAGDPPTPITAYGMNIRFSGGGDKCPDPGTRTGLTSTLWGTTMPLEAPAMPSRTVLLIETSNRPMCASGSSVWGTLTSSSSGTPSPNVGIYGDFGASIPGIRFWDFPVLPYGHGDGCNIAFADGHVKFLKGPRLIGTTQPQNEAQGPIALNYLTWWNAVNPPAGS